jgi:Protein of unknown function (DUF3047)
MIFKKFSIGLVIIAALLQGCAQSPTLPAPGDAGLTRAPGIVFAPSNDPSDAAWLPINIRFKTPSTYTRAEIDGVPCILGEANASWSLHVTNVPTHFASAAKLSWRWHIPTLVNGADNQIAGLDDAPARLVIAFKGDREKLDASDRATMSLAKALGGHLLPYAAIQYIWERKAAVDAVIPNANIARIKKVVVRSGEAGLAKWQSFERDVRADYRKAFPGEEPGEIESIGLMTDTDSLGGMTRACYANVELR